MADYFESGFCVREASWHRKELLLPDYPEDWDAARMAAGLMWEPRIVPLYKKDEAGNFVEVETTRLVERDDDGGELGPVSTGFELITHGEMGEIAEVLLDQANVKFETAGSVRGGRQVFMLIRLDEPYNIAGDVDGFGDPVLTMPYFAILNSHDGTGACKGLYTQVRVVCWNTVQAADAEGERHGAQFVLRHTSGVKQRLDEAKDILRGARAEALRWVTIAEALAQQPVTAEQKLNFLNEFIPEPPAGVTSERVKANINRDRELFNRLLDDSATNMAMADNALGLFNASVEFLDHARGWNNAQTYMGRQLLRAEPLKTKALTMVRELVGIDAN